MNVLGRRFPCRSRQEETTSGRRRVAAVMAAAIAFAAPLFASAAPAGDTGGEVQPARGGQAVTVITASEFRNYGATTLAEILRTAAGVAVLENGPLGAFSSVSLRGSTYQQVPVFLDGIRLNPSATGGFDLSDLPASLDSIERMEILRGCSSVLSGPDAASGAVNIVTRKPVANSAALGGALGGHGYTSVLAGGEGREDNAYYMLSADRERSHGYRLNSDAVLSVAGIKAGYDMGPGSSIELSANYLENDRGLPGPVQAPSLSARQRTETIVSGMRYRVRASESLDFTMSAYRNQDRSDFVDPDLPLADGLRYTGISSGAETRIAWRMGRFNRLTLGAEQRQDRFRSVAAGDHASDLSSVFLEDELSAGDSLVITAGGRKDRHSVYGNAWGPRAGARYRFSDSGLTLRGSYGKSTRTPAFLELYGPGGAGNPDLLPERTVEYEGGLEQTFEGGSVFGVSLFKRTVRDLIAGHPGAAAASVNVARVRISGAEAEVKMAISQTASLLLTGMRLFPVNESTGERLFSDVSGIPDRQYAAVFMAALDKRTVLSLDGRRVRNFVLPGDETWEYYTVDGKITETRPMQKGGQAEVFIGMKNMFNRKYETVKGHPMPTQELYGGITARF